MKLSNVGNKKCSTRQLIHFQIILRMFLYFQNRILFLENGCIILNILKESVLNKTFYTRPDGYQITQKWPKTKLVMM